MAKMRLLSQAELREAKETRKVVFLLLGDAFVPGIVAHISEVTQRPLFVSEDPRVNAAYVKQTAVFIPEET